MATTLFTQNTIACIWDFDKTLIPDYMQAPLFRRYGVNEPQFWKETNSLAEHYKHRGYHISGEIAYLNHILTHVLGGQMTKLNNRVLRECGREIVFYPGLPDFLDHCRGYAQEKAEYRKHEIQLEHYVVSTGLAEMIRGSTVASKVDGIWGCEFVENPLQPGFLDQEEFALSAEAEIAQQQRFPRNHLRPALHHIGKLGDGKNGFAYICIADVVGDDVDGERVDGLEAAGWIVHIAKHSPVSGDPSNPDDFEARPRSAFTSRGPRHRAGDPRPIPGTGRCRPRPDGSAPSGRHP